MEYLKYWLSAGWGVDEVTRCKYEGRREEYSGCRKEQGSRKGCVNQMKTAVCALESGACGTEWPEGQAGGHSICELPWSSPLGVPGPCAERSLRDFKMEKVVLGKASTQAKAV